METIKLWVVAGIAVISILGIMGSMDYKDRLIDETVKEETISQAVADHKREELELKAKK